MNIQCTPCDLLVTDANLIRSAYATHSETHSSIAVTAGRIIEIGAAEALAGKYVPRERLSAHGGIVMPGLVNTHNHTPLMNVRGIAPDLGFAPAYIKGIPQGDALSGDEAYALARLGAMEMVAFGSTTIVDHYEHPDACARAAAEIGARAFIGGRIMDVNADALSNRRWERDRAKGERTLRDNIDVIEQWHGHNGGLIQCVLAPHAPDTCSAGLLREISALAREKDVQVHLHLAQSQLELETVEQRDGRHPVELLDDIGLISDNLVAAHVIFVGQNEIETLGRAKANIAHTPMGNAQGGMIAPVWALQQAGARITLCTDTKSGDMFEAMRASIWMARIKGAGFDIKARSAMQWATSGGAMALRLGDEVGRLEVGTRADLIVLDPLAPNLKPAIDSIGIVVHAGNGGNVVSVVIDGNIVVKDRRFINVDQEEIVNEAQSVSERLWQASDWGSQKRLL